MINLIQHYYKQDYNISLSAIDIQGTSVLKISVSYKPRTITDGRGLYDVYIPMEELYHRDNANEYVCEHITKAIDKCREILDAEKSVGILPFHSLTIEDCRKYLVLHMPEDVRVKCWYADGPYLIVIEAICKDGKLFTIHISSIMNEFTVYNELDNLIAVASSYNKYYYKRSE